MRRRQFIQACASTLALAAYGGRAAAQGIRSRSVKPQPRGKPSGIPFHARFTDIAAASGPRAPVIYGGVDRKHYILETVGCGVRVLRLRQRRLARHLPAERHAARGARRGRDQPPVQEQSRRHVHRRHREGGPACAPAGRRRSRVGDYNNDGHEDLFITYWGQNVLYRNNGDGTFTDVTAEGGPARCKTRAGARAARSSTTTATAISICSSPTISNSTSSKRSEARPRTPTATGKACP